MKNVLIYSFWSQGYQEACQMEAANRFLHDGDNVLFITCGSKIGFCNENVLGCTPACKICQKMQVKRAEKWVSKKLKVKSINEYITDEIEEYAKRFIFEYDSLESLKDLRFEGVEIGYGAISSYVTYTRNMEPDMVNVKPYLDELMRMEIKAILAFKTIIKEFIPELIVFHNGRFAHFKPVLGLAEFYHIDFCCTETITASDGSILIDELPNNTVSHDLVKRGSMFKAFYELNKDTDERESVGRSFFENRRNAVFAGDKIYVENQVLGKMPDGWRTDVDNIVIFNSSEDEFFAIGSEYKEVPLYKNQLEGIKALLDHYKSDKSKHFTLRIHPNLKGLPFHYHTDLLNLDYPNLTIISADSDISSYALLDAADKIITFGSTMGIESTYWQKPSICMAYGEYRYLDVVYIPKDIDELWSLIDNSNLKPKERDNCLPYGYYYMSNKHESFKYINVGKTLYYNFYGRKRICGFNYYNILGSVMLYNYFKSIWDHMSRTHPLFSAFQKLPM